MLTAQKCFCRLPAALLLFLWVGVPVPISLAQQVAENGQTTYNSVCAGCHGLDGRGSDKAVKPGEGLLNLDDLEVRVDPRAEWQQMFHEVWRIERDFLYDPGFHGLDLQKAEKHYRPFVDQVASRRDLNYLFQEMLSDLSLGHVYVTGGETPDEGLRAA